MPRSRQHAGYGVKLERTPHLRLARHPGAPAVEEWRRWARGVQRPIALDLFCGAGGLSLGLENAGFEVALAVDVDTWALETHRHNFRGESLELDLSSDAGIDQLLAFVEGVKFDLVAGGPPCQPYSRAGRYKIRSLVEAGEREATDVRRELWRSYLKVVEALRPRAVLMENVPDMALGDELLAVREMTERLEAAGYETDVAIMDAWRFGVPQHRQRLFVTALRDGKLFDWPRPGRMINLREAIGDLPRLGETTGSAEMAYRGPRRPFQVRARRGLGKDRRVLWDHITRPVRADDRKAFNLMTSKTKYADLPPKLQRYRADIFDDKYKRLNWNERSRSITAHIAKDGYWYIHPAESRTLTVREAARIQTFPDRYRFAGSRSHAFAQIGNAVPPSLAEAIGRSLIKGLSKPKSPTAQLPSRRWRRLRKRLLAWAKRDMIKAPWRYPSDPWTVIVGTLLESRSGIGEPTPAQFLDLFPKPTSVSRTQIDRLARQADNGTQRSGVRRLGRLATAAGRRKLDGELLESMKLFPAERDRVRALIERDGHLMLNSGALRVIARLTGTRVNQVNKLTDGRLLLARFVGTGEESAFLNSALVTLGTTVCTATEPRCGACPLGADCKTRLLN